MPLGGKAIYFVLTIPLISTLAYLVSNSHYYADVLAKFRPPVLDENNAASQWWIDFLNHLEDTRVRAPPPAIDGRAPPKNWPPKPDAKRPELLVMSKEDEDKWRESHSSFVSKLAHFAESLQDLYQPGTTGIVTTAGRPNFGQVISLVLMARQAGSQLPIQVILDSSEAWIEYVCDNIFPRYNVTCVELKDVWADVCPFVPKLEFQRFQWKSLSILASTFQNVLFLDSDALPVLNPDPIFDTGAEPFTSTGFISWPDFWTQSASSAFFSIAGDVEVPPLTSRTTSESGVMVYDKARHADTLLLAAYYNFNGPVHYYPLTTQHGPGEGDKETFFLAALVLEALEKVKHTYRQPTWWMMPSVSVKKGYWDVKMLPKVRHRCTSCRGMLMQQMDPIEDYRAVMAAIEKHKKEQNARSEVPAKQGARKYHRLALPSGTFWERFAPAPTPEVDINEYLTDSSFLAQVYNLTFDHNPKRYMFLHHNGVKLDFTRILDPKSQIILKDKKGHNTRLWDDPQWMIDRVGRDVEKMLWEDSMRIYCDVGLGKWANVCNAMREIWKEVYQ